MESSALLRYGNEEIPYDLIHSPRRKTLGIEVHPDLRVVVRVPPGYSIDEIHRRVRRRAPWISRQLVGFQRFLPRTPARHYVAGESHFYLGRKYRLKLVLREEVAVRMKGDSILVSSPQALTPARVWELLNAWYREKARHVFASVLGHAFAHFERRGHRLPKLKARSMKRRWGSLSESGLMTLNIELIKAPRSCIEYVVTHELCHLMHKDHSKAFFRLLVRLMPDWQQRKARLERTLL